ncbi:MAG TPA: hypothetical protein VII18_11510 [Mycobacterium sp.]
MTYPVNSKQVGAFKTAIEAGGHVALWPEQYAAYIETLAWFVGGPLDSVDAFVARAQAAGGLPDQIFTLWLKGNSIGLLGVTYFSLRASMSTVNGTGHSKYPSTTRVDTPAIRRA